MTPPASGLPVPVRELVDVAAPIGLDELQRTAALRTRVDRKYVVGWETLALVLAAMAGTHRSLQIDGQRTFRYESVYFDSPELAAFRAHMQQRRRRYKVRSRHYVDSGLQTFEVKLKGRRGETIKHQLPYDDHDLTAVTAHAREFLTDRLGEAYPRLEVPELEPVLSNRYRRMTFASEGERMTVDFDLHYADAGSHVVGLDPGHVIIESKCERGLGTADRELRALGIRPVVCSKYCVGVGLLRDDVKVNDLRWLLRRYFAWDEPAGRPHHPAPRTARA